MFLIDDLLLRAVGISLKPFDMVWMLELLHSYALKERYNIQNISNQIKENRLLFEIGEINEDEYKKKHQLLLEERSKAEEIMASLCVDMNIQEL